MNNQEAIEEIKSRISTTEYVGGSYVDCVDLEALKLAISALHAQEQIRWERDIAIQQLKELGYGLGEEIRTDDDLISRQAAIDYVDDVPYVKGHPIIGLLWKAWIEQLPSAQLGPCEDAVSRKDVIDLYKRGAERIAKVKGMSVEELPHRGLDVLMNLPSVMPVRDCNGCRFKFLPERKEEAEIEH